VCFLDVGAASLRLLAAAWRSRGRVHVVFAPIQNIDHYRLEVTDVDTNKVFSEQTVRIFFFYYILFLLFCLCVCLRVYLFFVVVVFSPLYGIFYILFYCFGQVTFFVNESLSADSLCFQVSSPDVEIKEIPALVTNVKVSFPSG
jgi:hypothetical protein